LFYRLQPIVRSDKAMISPSLLELDIARGIGSRTSFVDAAVRSRVLRRRRRIAADVLRLPITLREAVAQDREALARLAELDGHRLPIGPQVVAVADGRILAAAEVTSGTTIADPFRPTAGAVGLLRLRAQQLRRELTA
jgi:hypothetical protein